jgi:general secretion pathway protein D
MTRRLLILLAALLIGGCAGQEAFREGRALVESGNIEQGLAKVEEASRAEPANQEYRTYYYRQREIAVQRLLALAERARSVAAYDEAEAGFRRVLRLDAGNARAKAGLEAVRLDRQHGEALVQAEELARKGDDRRALAKAREIVARNPGHREALELVRRIEAKEAKAESVEPPLAAAMRKRVTLEFREAGIRAVFDLLSRNTGLNFIFDREVRPDLRTTIAVENSTVEDVIRFLLVTNQLERKVLNESTLLIYPNTPAKNREYKDLVVRSFYLANADAKQTANMIRALVKTRDLFIDEKLNLLVIRDTPEAVRIAERLVAAQDLGEPEVMLEVEVLEVGSNVLQQIGIQWPGQISYSVIGGAGVPGTVTLPEWLGRDSRLIQMTLSDPLFVLSLMKQDGRTNVLANPRIRVKNRDKARIHIGDKVPVITSTTTATGFVSESVSYLDIGLKLEVEPSVYLEGEVGIKVGLEVSNIVREIRSATGTVTYQVGTRNAATTLRLKDGETQVLAGLISDEDRRTASKVPGLGDLPLIGRLFSHNSDTINKTEIVLLITPHVIRNLARPDSRLEKFHSGTEAEVGGAPLALPGAPPRPAPPLVAPPPAPPAAPPPPAPAQPAR